MPQARDRVPPKPAASRFTIAFAIGATFSPLEKMDPGQPTYDPRLVSRPLDRLARRWRQPWLVLRGLCIKSGLCGGRGQNE